MAGSFFDALAPELKSEECVSALVILVNACQAADSFLNIFESIHDASDPARKPTDEEQDLLRASLVFASAGLDSLVKQLIRDALPSVIDLNSGAESKFASFVEKHLRSGAAPDYQALAGAIIKHNPRAELVRLYIRELTSGSLQSTDALFKAGAAFDLETRAITDQRDELKETFDLRNKIVHEMDVALDSKESYRHTRDKESMVRHTSLIFKTAESFLMGVDRKISSPAKTRLSP